MNLNATEINIVKHLIKDTLHEYNRLSEGSEKDECMEHAEKCLLPLLNRIQTHTKEV